MRSMLNNMAAYVLVLSFALPAGAAETAAQPSGTATAKKKKTTQATAQRFASSSSTAQQVTSEDIRQLREMLQQQQQQIQQLQQQLQQRDEQTRANEQAARQAQEAAASAAQKAEAAQASTEAVTKLQSDVADLKTNVGNVAINAQDVDKRIALSESLAGRFRLSGDIRVRGESFFQRYDGCGAACTDRHRARIRVRLGIDGKLNEDFIGGLALATGANVNGGAGFFDPVSTNQTLADFFERNTIGLDRGYLTYNPHYAKWLTLTGGKWAYSWNRTPLTFDNDLNPEGFNAKASFDLRNAFLKNVNVQALALLYNEVGAGPDSNAVGGSASARLQLGRLITWTPTYTVLNWNGSDTIAQAAFPVSLPNPNTTPVGTPMATPTTQPVRLINANSFTNATVITGTGTNQRRAFLSDFMYSDFLNDFSVLTPWRSWPLRILVEYEKNLRARIPAPGAGKQDTAYWLEAAIGQQRNRNDLQFGYSFADVDQDAVISQFNESDMRAPTNVKQHRLYANWLIASNTTVAFTMWRGHTKYTGFQNSARAAGLAPGAPDPFLNRLQFDIIYKF